MIDEAQQYIMNTYGRFPLVLEKGEGSYLFDTQGKKYLDLCAGIAVNALGYNNAKINEAITNQMQKLFHVSNLYYTEPQIDVAKLLIDNSPFAKVFFCNSGAEANEAALKLARKYGKSKHEKKTNIVSMYQSFHGRTYGAISATGQIKYQQSFLPTLEGFQFATYNDIESVKELLNEDVCAVIIEVIQGEGGIRPADCTFLQEVADLCSTYDALLIVDEVQTGVGRTGSLFAFEQFGITPDIVTLAKGLGGGVPIGAMLCNEKADILVPGDHASTFGGNALVTSVAKVVLTELLEGDLLAHVQEVGNYLTEKLKELQNKYCDTILEVRGKGLMQGIELSIPAKETIAKCMDLGLLLVGAGEKIIRFVPPLIITKEEIDEAIHILDQGLES
jgi:acetylornithine/N-succinyldiaminopimelate aminotransferase